MRETHQEFIYFDRKSIDTIEQLKNTSNALTDLELSDHKAIKLGNMSEIMVTTLSEKKKADDVHGSNIEEAKTAWIEAEQDSRVL